MLEPPPEHYEHGWGEDCHDARPIIASWTLTVIEIHSHAISLSSDLVRGESPLIIGLDVMQYSRVTFLSIRGEDKAEPSPSASPSYPLRLRVSPWESSGAWYTLQCKGHRLCRTVNTLSLKPKDTIRGGCRSHVDKPLLWHFYGQGFAAVRSKPISYAFILSPTFVPSGISSLCHSTCPTQYTHAKRLQRADYGYERIHKTR